MKVIRVNLFIHIKSDELMDWTLSRECVRRSTFRALFGDELSQAFRGHIGDFITNPSTSFNQAKMREFLQVAYALRASFNN